MSSLEASFRNQGYNYGLDHARHFQSRVPPFAAIEAQQPPPDTPFQESAVPYPPAPTPAPAVPDLPMSFRSNLAFPHAESSDRHTRTSPWSMGPSAYFEAPLGNISTHEPQQSEMAYHPLSYFGQHMTHEDPHHAVQAHQQQAVPRADSHDIDYHYVADPQDGVSTLVAAGAMLAHQSTRAVTPNHFSATQSEAAPTSISNADPGNGSPPLAPVPARRPLPSGPSGGHNYARSTQEGSVVSIAAGSKSSSSPETVVATPTSSMDSEDYPPAGNYTLSSAPGSGPTSASASASATLPLQTGSEYTRSKLESSETSSSQIHQMLAPLRIPPFQPLLMHPIRAEQHYMRSTANVVGSPMDQLSSFKIKASSEAGQQQAQGLHNPFTVSREHDVVEQRFQDRYSSLPAPPVSRTPEIYSVAPSPCSQGDMYAAMSTPEDVYSAAATPGHFGDMYSVAPTPAPSVSSPIAAETSDASTDGSSYVFLDMTAAAAAAAAQRSAAGTPSNGEHAFTALPHLTQGEAAKDEDGPSATRGGSMSG